MGEAKCAKGEGGQTLDPQTDRLLVHNHGFIPQ
jgi:hypothetical protein